MNTHTERKSELGIQPCHSSYNAMLDVNQRFSYFEKKCLIFEWFFKQVITQKQIQETNQRKMLQLKQVVKATWCASRREGAWGGQRGLRRRDQGTF